MLRLWKTFEAKSVSAPVYVFSVIYCLWFSPRRAVCYIRLVFILFKSPLFLTGQADFVDLTASSCRCVLSTRWTTLLCLVVNVTSVQPALQCVSKNHWQSVLERSIDPVARSKASCYCFALVTRTLQSCERGIDKKRKVFLREGEVLHYNSRNRNSFCCPHLVPAVQSNRSVLEEELCVHQRHPHDVWNQRNCGNLKSRENPQTVETVSRRQMQSDMDPMFSGTGSYQDVTLTKLVLRREPKHGWTLCEGSWRHKKLSLF